MKKLTSLFAMIMAVTICSCSPKSQQTVSPNGKINVSVNVAEGDNGAATFTVTYNDNGKVSTVLSDARLGIETDEQIFSNNMKLAKVSKSKSISESYDMVSGKRSHCTNEGTERTYSFVNDQKRTLEVVMRVYNDGVAYCYKIANKDMSGEAVTSELTAYTIPDGTKRWFQSYAIDYEGFFPLSTDGKVTGWNRFPNYWGYPALFEADKDVFALLTEANVTRDHSGSRLFNGNDANVYEVKLVDESLAFGEEYISPWRVIIIGSLSDIVESTLVTDVSDPCKIDDTDWIVPGKAAWIYWAYNHGSKDFKIVKEYIDLAAEMKWPYDLIDWEWDVMENGGDINDAIAYAHSKGVKPVLWYNSGTSWIGEGAPGPLDRLNTKENREKEYQRLSEMGVAGLKIDFFAIDGAEIMNYYIDLLEDAAKYKLMINFHGATIPRGWQRTYPNLMTTEAVYGAEWYNNRPTLTDRAASHNATLPFTRNVVGPMDYTPCTFTDSQNPHITTHAHELALPVLFESGWQNMADRPSAYLTLPEPVKQMLTELPAAWDDTELLSGYPGEEVVIARRSGEEWYVGGINGTDVARQLNFTLDFLTEAKSVTLIKDGADGKSFEISTIDVADGQTPVTVDCLPRGGFVAVIK